MSAFQASEAIIPPIGMVKLSEKQRPTCERTDLEDSAMFAFTRAELDVSDFRDKIRSLPATIWEDENQNGNVKLHRPAHDAWGIKKIVFTFCDDFLLKVFDLPWSRSEEWRKFLVPIYEAIGIDESKVVRCLLASMPPGMTIPVHHDTGYWVKHTHRCHVAIESSEDVDFLVGANEENMRKVLFSVGRIVELNNQAKHMVTNNMNTWRIHLIFDYVDDHALTRYLLQPGEKLNQTRRSIDLAKDEGSRMAPSFVIIGAQKCGTTSIYEFLCQHPLVLRGKRRETHFFDWRWNDKLSTSPEQLKYYMNFYHAEALHKYPSLFTGESTPSYLFHSDIVLPRLKAVCPWTQLIAVFRNPVDRAYSQYQMCIDKEGTPEQLHIRGMSNYIGKTFDCIVEEEIDELESLGIEPKCSYETFRDKFLVTRRELTHGGHSIVARGLYALQLEPWIESFPLGECDSRLHIALMGDLRGGRERVQNTMDKIFKHIGLPPHDLDDVEAKNTRPYEPMSEAVRNRLETFYAPYNERLKQLIGAEQLDW